MIDYMVAVASNVRHYQDTFANLGPVLKKSGKYCEYFVDGVNTWPGKVKAAENIYYVPVNICSFEMTPLVYMAKHNEFRNVLLLHDTVILEDNFFENLDKALQDLGDDYQAYGLKCGPEYNNMALYKADFLSDHRDYLIDNYFFDSSTDLNLAKSCIVAQENHLIGRAPRFVQLPCIPTPYIEENYPGSNTKRIMEGNTALGIKKYKANWHSKAQWEVNL